MNDKNFFFGLKHPFSMQMVGPTGCGKTELIFKIIAGHKQIIDKEIKKIYYIYGIHKKKFDEFSKRLVKHIQ